MLGRPSAEAKGPDEVPLTAVLHYYMEQHGKKIRSASAARRACKLVTEYMTAVTKSSAYVVSEFNLSRQQAFMRWLSERDLSTKTISTYLSTVKAAIRLAATPRLIVEDGFEREAQFLSRTTHIQDSERDVSKVIGKPIGRPRQFVPTLEEMARFLDAIRGDGSNDDAGNQAAAFRYMIIALNTWARPEAITDLNVAEQVDFERGTVDLNPRDRVQTRKYRPVIPLTDNLRGWLAYWGVARPICRGIPAAKSQGLLHGAPVKNVEERTIKKIAIAAGVPDFVRYSVRHFMATRIRTTGITVTTEERSEWIGHKNQNRQTDWYTHMDPDFLEAPRRATDAIMTALDKLCTKSLFAPGTIIGSRLTVIENKSDRDDGKTSASR